MGRTDTRSVDNVLSDILHWSTDLPIWQRDALRRIVEQGQLTTEDLDELTELCRFAAGMESEAPDPLSSAHIPSGEAAGVEVAIQSISHVENVNALDATQVLTFGQTGLTVVFGYNGSGKSGYGRVIRGTCRARSKGEPILENVLVPSKGDPASAEICYSLDGKEQPPEQWIDGQRLIDPLGSVSFFDSACAAVHVRERHDIAFTPFGLDVLPKLGSACKEIHRRLDLEKKRLEAERPKFLTSVHATGSHAVGKLLLSLRHNTPVATIESIASLDEVESQRLKDIPVQLASDPTVTSKELRSRADRVESLATRISTAVARLANASLAKLKSLADDATHKKLAADAAAKMAFSGDPLPEIGEPAWRELWEAARRYSGVVNPEEEFPVTEPADSLCVLCQQPLGDEAKDRLRRFEQFVTDDTAKKADEAQSVLTTELAKYDRLGLRDAVVKEQLKDVEFADAELNKRVRQTLAALLHRLRMLGLASQKNDWSFPITDELPDAGEDLQSVAAYLRKQAENVEKTADAAARKRLEDDLAELKAREWLATVLGDVKEEVTRLAEIQRLKVCIQSTRTNAITAKSKELAKNHVTDRLRDAFATEIKKMHQGVRRLNVELVADAGEFGSSYYRVRLVGAQKADLASVVSEGEHRCIALAGFLSELATEHSKSAIVFDDPVTSLDHHWRECFARRLVEEAIDRQVIVFTHDIVFLHDLIAGAERSGTPLDLQRVRANRDVCGCVTDGLPWIAQKTLPRIDDLEKRTRAARSDYDAHNDDVYDRSISAVYDDMRATVERAVEEFLFKNVVLRHRDYINLTNLRMMTAVTTDHCERLQALFQRCCDITTAHDRSSLRSFGVPSPDDALDDLKELRDVIDDVKDCQKSIT